MYIHITLSCVGSELRFGLELGLALGLGLDTIIIIPVELVVFLFSR